MDEPTRSASDRYDTLPPPFEPTPTAPGADVDANLAALTAADGAAVDLDLDDTYDLPVESEGFAELARAVRAAERRRAEMRDESRKLLAEAELEKHLIRAEAQRDADSIRQDARGHAFRVREHAEKVGAQMIADADRYAVTRQIEADRILREARVDAEHELAEASRRADLLFRELLDHASVNVSSTEDGTRRILRTLDEARAHARDQLEQILRDLQATTERLEYEAMLGASDRVRPTPLDDEPVMIDLTTDDHDDDPSRAAPPDGPEDLVDEVDEVDVVDVIDLRAPDDRPAPPSWAVMSSRTATLQSASGNRSAFAGAEPAERSSASGSPQPSSPAPPTPLGGAGEDIPPPNDLGRDDIEHAVRTAVTGAFTRVFHRD